MSTAAETTPVLAPVLATDAPLPPSGAGMDAPFDLTIDVVERMVEHGLLPDDRRIYLRDGRLYEKMAKSIPHGSVGAAITRVFVRRLPDEWSLWPESTMVLDPKNAPLPDFAVIRSGDLIGRVAPARYPEPKDVGLFLEIGVSSLREDLTTRLERYARALIPVYWVVDVLGLRILIHSEPRVVDGQGVYGHVETYRPGQSLPLVLDGQEVARIPFDELLR